MRTSVSRGFNCRQGPSFGCRGLLVHLSPGMRVVVTADRELKQAFLASWDLANPIMAGLLVRKCRTVTYW